MLPNDAVNAIAYKPALHRLALLTAATTLVLIFMGGLVTSHGAGMSVPDWPNSFGYNMFLLPPSAWLSRQAGGVFYEHSHRLMATVVGLLSIGLVAQAWGWAANPRVRKWIGRSLIAILALSCICVLADQLARGRTSLFAKALHHSVAGLAGVAIILAIIYLSRAPEPRASVRWLAVAALGAVIFQGLLGGLRVVFVELKLAVVHACFAQAFLCIAVLLAVTTSRWWLAVQPSAQARARAAGIYRLAVAATILIYFQLIIGALMRHYDAGLAIPDVPLSYGKVLPPASSTELARVNWMRTVTLGLKPVSLGQIWLHAGHRIGALVVSIAIVVLLVRIFRMRREVGGLAGLGGALCIAWLTQITLGICTVIYRKPADIASTHVAVGAVVLAVSFAIAARSARLSNLGKNYAVTPEPRNQAGFPMDLRPAVAEDGPAFQPA